MIASCSREKLVKKRKYADATLFGANKRKKNIEELKENCSEVPFEKKWINQVETQGGKVEQILLSDKVARVVKDHQLEGLRFLWKCVVEENSGSILAHSMGLGKSLQSILFIDLFLKQRLGSHIMLSAPNSVLSSWENEISNWSTSLELEAISKINVYNFSDCTGEKDRITTLEHYKNNGGILLISQNIVFQILAMSKNSNPYKQKSLQNRFLRHKDLYEQVFISPGPDVIIVDEASMMKSEENLFHMAVSEMDTTRRILLTGTPFQNNLKELFAMVTFVRPGYWRYEEFKSLFIDPICYGSLRDSSDAEVQLMKWRSFILVMQLRTVAHRVTQQILIDTLPEKKEFVLMIQPTQLQRQLCEDFVSFLKTGDGIETVKKFGGLLKCVAILHKIVNSPDLLRRFIIDHKVVMTQKSRNLILKSYSEMNHSFPSYKDEEILKLSLDTITSSLCETRSNSLESIQEYEDSNDPLHSGEQLHLYVQQASNYQWALPVLSKDYVTINLSQNAKMMIMYSILEKAFQENRKVLIFSQFTSTLDIIEMFFKKYPINEEFLKPGITYSRLDGKTPTKLRKNLIETFNDEEWPSKVFLLSTKAGGIGLNLQAASCLILIDVMWNPTNDNQALCRCFRFGQKRDVRVYRLVASGTVEDTIYKKTLNKVWLSRRIIDDEINRRFLYFDQVFEFKFQGTKEIEEDTKIDPSYANDSILSKVYNQNSDLINAIYKHEGLYVEDPEGIPTSEEMLESIRDFEDMSAQEQSKIKDEERTHEMEVSPHVNKRGRSYSESDSFDIMENPLENNRNSVNNRQLQRMISREISRIEFRRQIQRILPVVDRHELIRIICSMWNVTYEVAEQLLVSWESPRNSNTILTTLNSTQDVTSLQHEGRIMNDTITERHNEAEINATGPEGNDGESLFATSQTSDNIIVLSDEDHDTLRDISPTTPLRNDISRGVIPSSSPQMQELQFMEYKFPNSNPESNSTSKKKQVPIVIDLT